jgi:hypothetical protein
MIYVKVDKQYLDNLARAMAYSEDAVANAVAQTAMFHANYVLGSIPEAVKGKLFVQLSDTSGAGEYSADITYTLKPSGEGATATTQKTFLPLDKLSQPSTRRPVISSGGEQGIFVTGMTTLGRTSIENYLMKQAQIAVDRAEEPTLEIAMESARKELMEYFASHGVIYNAELGRFVATEAAQLPWGTSVQSGTIIAGEF